MRRGFRWRAALAVGLTLLAFDAAAQSAGPGVGLVEKKVFAMADYTTVSGRTIHDVRMGWESYGTLNAARDNVVIVLPFFAGNSHAAGRYKADDKAPGYWDTIIGPGRPVDTGRFFVVGVDGLVNVYTKDPNVTTTGPASLDPATGKPYAMNFPIVTVRDFVRVEKALLDSLGVRKVHAAMGASMGAFQSLDWAAAYPEMVERAIPVIGIGETGAFAIERLDLWATPIRLDPNWNRGDYYGKAEPLAGLAASFKTVGLDTGYWGWADRTFGRKLAVAGQSPLASWDNEFAVEAALQSYGAGLANISDANSFLYLVRVCQLFAVGQKDSLAAGLADIKAKVLFIPAKSDLLLVPAQARRAAALLRRQGKTAEVFEIAGDRGHLEGILNIVKAAEPIRRFLAD